MGYSSWGRKELDMTEQLIHTKDTEISNQKPLMMATYFDVAIINAGSGVIWFVLNPSSITYQPCDSGQISHSLSISSVQ